MARCTIWIPLVPLTEPGRASAPSVLLEIGIEPGGYGADPDTSRQRLCGYGLARALADAQAALAAAGLPSPARNWTREPPVWHVANPDARLSNAAGAALGLALGELLYDGRCPGSRLIASGHFLPVSAAHGARLAPDRRLAGKLVAARALGPQAAPLPFLVPAHTPEGIAIVQEYAEPIAALSALNIPVTPVASLEEAVAACWRLDQDVHSAPTSKRTIPS